ncbi:conserved hypothetical protein [Neospora caninum Liverpool]|uniref:Cpw-wpc domain-containing protein n=1 Tax=Neospora caninum (strain Liverpool) TaxID=572307 RepID=F0VAE8_NEOCL|nr:conserved hypothetical protein [Neospora caninum Liverpool]CBZ50637.1 conserved hypothetical protein [Neospora caninum Liverpool]|eukprot:XP_003880670.1 conserved hypothetical protein [Neospora caninum Liverpool]
MWGHPIKIANPGYQWTIPAGHTVNDPAFGSLPSAPGVPVPETTGTNLLYGQTTTLSGRSLSPTPQEPSVPPPAGELPVVLGTPQGTATASSAQLYAASQTPVNAARGNVPIVSRAPAPTAVMCPRKSVAGVPLCIFLCAQPAFYLSLDEHEYTAHHKGNTQSASAFVFISHSEYSKLW